jgi:hypothetical protein
MSAGCLAKYERTVGKDHVIAFGGHSTQLSAKRQKRGYAGARVEVWHELDRRLVVWHGDERLYATPLPTIPE